MDVWYTKRNNIIHVIVFNKISLYLCQEVDLKACCLVGFRLAVIQIVPHCQHKLRMKTEYRQQVNTVV